MKISTLRRKIIVNFTILGVIISILGAGISYNFYARLEVDKKTEKIKSETLLIRAQAYELKSKTIEIKKYTEIYDKLSEAKKSTAGIKMDDVNAKLKTVADKYSIINPTIKVTLPETLKGGVFERKTVNVLFTTANLTFSAINDVKAFAFITEFMESLPGYIIVINLEIKKSKSYSVAELVEISIGKAKGNVSGKVDFFWYACKPKQEVVDEKKPATP